MKYFLTCAAFASIFFVVSCASSNSLQRLKDENLRLADQVALQQNEVDRLHVELLQAKAVADTHQEAETLYQEWISALEERVNESEGLNFYVDEETGESKIQIAEVLLFDPGKIDISEKGLESLTALAQQLKEAPGTLRIEGHTDNQPIRSQKVKTHSRDNWQLSVNRSLAVLRVLLQNEVSPEKLSIAGYSMYRPVEDNGLRGSSANRRVEIVFVPQVQVQPEGEATNVNVTPEVQELASDSPVIEKSTEEETTQQQTTQDR